MSGAVAVLDDVGARETALNRALAAGRFVAAYATYYDETALASELHDVPPADRDRIRVLRFFSWAERFHGVVPARCAAGTRVSRSEWTVPKPDGRAARPARRVVTRRWQRGRVIAERVEDTVAPGTDRRSGTF